MAPRRSPRAAAVLVAAVLVATAGGGCETARREREALELLRGAGDATAKARRARVLITLRSKPAAGRRATGSSAVPTPTPIALEAAVSFTGQAAAVTRAGQAAPLIVFDDTVVWMPRHRRGEGSDPRPWARLDLAPPRDEIVGDARSGLGFSWLNPAYLLTLMRADLIGSPEGSGRETVRGVAATRYEVQFEKDTRDQPVKRRKALDAQLRTMGHRRPDVRGAVWISPDGVVLRVLLELEQRVDRLNRFDTEMVAEYYDLAAPVTVAPPSPAQAVTLKRFAQLVEEVDVPAGP